MGITGLLNLLKAVQRPCSLSEFVGRTIGVDAYGWLHRGSVHSAAELALGNSSMRYGHCLKSANQRYVDFAMGKLRMLSHFGITPYLVFDGDFLPSKAATEVDREKRRRESLIRGKALFQAGKVYEARLELQKAVDISPEMAKELINELKRHKVQYIVAPYEADSQLAYLERKGIIDAVLSEDSDLLVFGVKTLLTKLDNNGTCLEIRRDRFSECKELNMGALSNLQLRRMAILSGCDYLEGVPKIGLKTAYRFVTKCDTLERLLQSIQLTGKYRMPVGYQASFEQAEKTFLYQWVYDPVLEEVVNLNPAEDADPSDMLFLGAQTTREVARQVAAGDLHPVTRMPLLSNPSQRPLTNLRPLLSVPPHIPNTKIEDFFQPYRVPLAELDPNSLQLKIGQTLEASLRQPYSSSPSYRAMRSSLGTAVGPPLDDVFADVEEANEYEASKYFGIDVPRRGQEPHRKHRKRKAADINIYSDDSLAEALAELPELASSAVKSVETSFIQTPDAAGDVEARRVVQKRALHGAEALDLVEGVNVAASPRAYSATADESLDVFDGVAETPLLHKQVDGRGKPALESSGISKLDLSRFLNLKPKGSEDILIGPSDSEGFDSEAEAGGGASDDDGPNHPAPAAESSPVPAKARMTGNRLDECKTETHTKSPESAKLDLKRLLFTAAA